MKAKHILVWLSGWIMLNSGFWDPKFAVQGQVPLGPTTLAEAYSILEFDPTATNCATMVQISDIHMNESTQPLTWEMDERLVNAINGITPRPDVLAIAGDLGAAGAASPGFPAVFPYATNEIARARLQLTRITNFARSYVVPGNHDSMYGRSDGFLFTNIFQGFSRFTNFTIAGLPVLMLDSQNGGWLDPEQLRWLAGWKRQLDKSKPVMVMLHIPLFVGGEPSLGRESQAGVLWFLEGWRAPTWIGAGHNHFRFQQEYDFGTTHITQYATPAANQHISHSPDWADGLSSGFAVWCITNGTVKGVVSWAATNGSYFILGSDPAKAAKVQDLSPYDCVTNILFHVEEGHFDRQAYSLMVTNWPDVKDVTYFWIFAHDYRVRLPIEKYPNATRAFCLLLDQRLEEIKFYLGSDTNTWMEVPLEFGKNGLYSVVIPESLRHQPLWFQATGFANFAGFGLGTTNQMTDFETWAGRQLGDSKASGNTLTTSGVPAWMAYDFSVAIGGDEYSHWVLGPNLALPAPATYTNPSGDLDGNGVVDQNELDQVLANYWSNSPWIFMTNTANLGNADVQFTLTNASAWNFSVLSSTNLSDWEYLGPAYPTWQFHDSAATNQAQRFYRLRWP